jgi:hypothetical protein
MNRTIVAALLGSSLLVGMTASAGAASAFSAPSDPAPPSASSAGGGGSPHQAGVRPVQHQAALVDLFARVSDESRKLSLRPGSGATQRYVRA